MFLFFPVTVLSAYIADRHVSIYDYLSKTYGIGRHGFIVEMTTDEDKLVESSSFHFKRFDEEIDDADIRDFEGRFCTPVAARDHQGFFCPVYLFALFTYLACQVKKTCPGSIGC